MYLNGKKVFIAINNKRTLPIVSGGGQVYDEYDIVLTQDTGLTVKFLCNSIVDWGDGSTASGNTHTYSAYGEYTIKADGAIDAESEGSKFLNANDEEIAVLKAVRFVNNRIVPYCFYGQNNLISVTFSGFETEIPTLAFYACLSLAQIAIPSGVTSIGNSAFLSSGISGLVIPIGVTSIGRRAFAWCGGLSSITIPSGVERIEDSLFNGDYHLSQIYLPNSINYLGSEAFFEVNLLGDRMLNIYYNGTMAQWGNIEKANRWDIVGQSSVTVHCTDGEIYF